MLVRPLPHIGASTDEEVKRLAERSNAAVRECQARGEHVHIKWVASYIADDVVICVYKAYNAAHPPPAARGCAEKRGHSPVRDSRHSNSGEFELLFCRLLCTRKVPFVVSSVNWHQMRRHHPCGRPS